MHYVEILMSLNEILQWVDHKYFRPVHKPKYRIENRYPFDQEI